MVSLSAYAIRIRTCENVSCIVLSCLIIVRQESTIQLTFLIVYLLEIFSSTYKITTIKRPLDWLNLQKYIDLILAVTVWVFRGRKSHF